MEPQRPNPPALQRPLKNGFVERWGWDIAAPRKNLTQSVFEPAYHSGQCQYPSILLNPVWAIGSTGVRATKRLPWRGQTYWEITLVADTLGSSTMIGIATAGAALRSDTNVDLFGMDKHSWAFHQSGNLYHNGEIKPYYRPWDDGLGKKRVTIGTLFNGDKGTLIYYFNGICLGQAFGGLTKEGGDIFPAACTTRTNHEMHLHNLRRTHLNLQDRAREVILANLEDPLVACGCDHLCREGAIEKLSIPSIMKNYIALGQGENSHHEVLHTNFKFTHY